MSGQGDLFAPSSSSTGKRKRARRAVVRRRATDRVRVRGYERRYPAKRKGKR